MKDHNFAQMNANHCAPPGVGNARGLEMSAAACCIMCSYILNGRFAVYSGREVEGLEHMSWIFVLMLILCL